MVSPVPPVQKGYNSYHIAQAHKQLGRSAEKIDCIPKRPVIPDYSFIDKLMPWILVIGFLLLTGLFMHP